MFGRILLIGKLIAYILSTVGEFAVLSATQKVRTWQFNRLSPDEKNCERQNIVIIGASFAGYHAARLITGLLPARSPYRVVVIEPHSHFHFTWVLPRFCVIDQGHKAFIPYAGYLAGLPRERLQWIKGRVEDIGQKSVRLAKSGEEIPYAFLVIATGSGATMQLPSRIGADEREDGIGRLNDIREQIKKADDLVIVGGGAAGYELATDAKSAFPDKHVTLVHSRDTILNRFGPDLGRVAMTALAQLGVDVILGERLMNTEIVDGFVMLKSGRTIRADFVVPCTGQSANSSLLKRLASSSISSTQHILTKSTLQLIDANLPNIFACGDVVATTTSNTNARSAMMQATVVAKNVVSLATGKPPKSIYTAHWSSGFIKLTLGLGRSVAEISDGHAELLLHSKDKDDSLMVADAWKQLGETPFEDHELRL